MLQALHDLVREAGMATDLEEVLRIVVGGVRRAMHAEACTVLLLDPEGAHFVLRATAGLNPGGVGRVRVAAGRGLVGLVAEQREPLAVADAVAHPAYLDVPLAGEAHLAGFLGVPIIHYGRLIGVLTVQTRARRVFAKGDEAFLVTAAAQIAGAIEHASRDERIATLAWGRGRQVVLHGAPGAPGYAVGTLITGEPVTAGEVEPPVLDPGVEEQALREALHEVAATIRERGEQMADLLPAEAAAVFEVQALIAGDEQLLAGAVARIRARQPAAAAVAAQVAEMAAGLEASAGEDAYLRARAEDLRAVGRQVEWRLRRLARRRRTYPARTVLIDEEVGVDWIAEVPRGRLTAIVCLASAVSSHTAILARALGVPAVMSVGELPLARLEGSAVAVDGHRGQVILEPGRSLRREYRRLAGARRALGSRLAALREAPAVTRDGVEVALYVNVGVAGARAAYEQAGATGVGLCRTELQFALAERFPSEDDQVGWYRELLETFHPAPVTIRTLDIGGDKQLPYFPIDGEDNPVLGWRGIRVTLRHPEIFLPQLRSLLRANAGLGNLRILLPMVSTVDEVREARALLERARAALARAGTEVERPPLGVMIEVPAAVYQVGHLARAADFFAIGSNDLTQYLLAVDRDNPRVAPLLDPLHPAVLRVIHQAVRDARRCAHPIGVCGEMAADPGAALLLLAMGVDYLSMAPAGLGYVKWMVREVRMSDARRLLAGALRSAAAAAVRSRVNRALADRGLAELTRPGR